MKYLKPSIYRRDRREDIMRHLRTLMVSKMGHRNDPASLPPMAVITHDAIGEEIIAHGLYEREPLKLLFEQVFSDQRDLFARSVAIDVGANIGNHSIFFAKHFKKVLAFEPGEIAFALLNINKKIASCDNLELHNFGLGDQNTFSRMAAAEPDNIGTNTIIADEDGIGERIELRSGDEAIPPLLQGQERISLVKIDVEGFDEQVITGMKEILKTHSPIILFEVDGARHPERTERTVALLRSVGYGKFYTLKRKILFPKIRNFAARAVLRTFAGSNFVLDEEDEFQAYENMVIALPA